MVKKNSMLSLLVLLNTSLFSMEINNTISIITEASKATEILQDEFEILINEDLEAHKKENMHTSEIARGILLSPTIYDINKHIEVTATSINELNSSNKSSCQEDNNTIADNGCTDSNLGTSAEGLLIFKTRIKPYCEMTGEKFAKQFMQEDWEDIYHDKEFKMEVVKACPKMKKRYRDKWTPHLYQFSLEYASDSDAIPEC